MSYFQMFTLLNFGLIFIDRNSAVIKLQEKIIKEFISLSKPVLNKAGELTKRCRKEKYGKTEEGFIVLGLAEMIRAEKEAFKKRTEYEKHSLFMPATGFTSGLFCLTYLLFVPFFNKTSNIAWLYWLEYISEAVFVSQLMASFTILYKYAYRNLLTALLISFIWFTLPIALILILYICNWTISCFDAELYLYLFLLLPMMPFVILIGRIVYMIAERNNRLKSIRKKMNELSEKMKSFA